MQASTTNPNIDEFGKFVAQVNGDITRTYPESRIDILADSFQRLNAWESGVLFEDFLQALSGQPSRSLLDDELGMIPLCRKDQVLAKFIEQSGNDEPHELQEELERNDDVTCRNGTFVEPMHHTAYDKKKPKYQQAKQS